MLLRERSRSSVDLLSLALVDANWVTARSVHKHSEPVPVHLDRVDRPNEDDLHSWDPHVRENLEAESRIMSLVLDGHCETLDRVQSCHICRDMKKLLDF